MAASTIQQRFDQALRLHQAGHLHEAEQRYRQILVEQPEHSGAIHFLGMIAHQAGHNDVALDLIRRSIALSPDVPAGHNNLGNVLKEIGQLDDAVAAFRKAIALKGDSAEVHNNLGDALRDLGQLDDAIAACRQAIALSPDYAEAYANLANALSDKGRMDEAIAAYRQGLVRNSAIPEIHKNLSLALLRRGDFQEGWEEYEWRWKCGDFKSSTRNFVQPQWDGGPLKGRVILIHTEQGFGDAIQFIRYLPLVIQRGAKVIIECPAALERLFRTLGDEHRALVRGQPLPAFDVHCPLLSLPRAFQTSLASIPHTIPYLRADPELAQRWQLRLADLPAAAKVGLVWAGNSADRDDRKRSLNLARWAPLGKIPGVRFFSLQKGNASAEAKTPPPGMELVDWTNELNDFADTAAFVANLDLVISVDTAVAHLCGALDKPIWTLLPFSSDWRWLTEREDSPWYPSMRLFRQEAWGDWDSVISRVTSALSDWTRNRG
jgi:tetratricopeptide (TPR) repeat protein